MKRTFLSLSLLTVFCLGILTSCKGEKQSALKNLCDNLKSDYTCSISFKAKGQQEPIVGECELFHSEALTSLKITSPEILSELTVEYDTSGAPSSVAVRFKDFDASLPEGALTKINAVASLAADDFISILEKVSEDKIIEYEISEEESGYLAVVPYGDAEITLCFSKDGSTPYNLEYVSDTVNASVSFSGFGLIIKDLTNEDEAG